MFILNPGISLKAFPQEMSEIFQLKGFQLEHGNSSQKIGTDALLLGAWAQTQGTQFLDIGCGCGVIGFMLAQRFPDAIVHLIDSDQPSITELESNIYNAPFASRLRSFHCRFQEFNPVTKIDTVVCNPPYFQKHLLSPDAQRTAARHNTDFHLRDFFNQMSVIGNRDLIVNLVLPFDLKSYCLECAFYENLHPFQMLEVRHNPTKPLERVLMAFGREIKPCITQQLTILQDGAYTKDYLDLMRPFLLNI